MKKAYQKLLPFTAKASGVFLTLVLLAWLGVFTYEGCQQFIDNPALSGAIAAFSVAINASLIGTLFLDTQKQLFKSIFDRKHIKPTFITESLRPKTALYLKIASVVFVAFQAMAAIQISRDYAPETLIIPNACVLSIAYSVSAYFPVRQLTDWAFQEVLLKLGSSDEKETVTLFQKIETIKELVKAS